MCPFLPVMFANYDSWGIEAFTDVMAYLLVATPLGMYFMAIYDMTACMHLVAAASCCAHHHNAGPAT